MPGFFGGAREGSLNRGVGAGIAGVGPGLGTAQEKRAAGGVDMLIGKRRGVVPGAEFEAGRAGLGSVDELGDEKPTLGATEAIVQAVAGDRGVAGGGIECVAVVDAAAPRECRGNGAGEAHAGSGDEEGGAGVYGVGRDKGGPAEGAIVQVATAVGAAEFFIGQEGTGAQRPTGMLGFEPPGVEAGAVECFDVTRGQKSAEVTTGGAAALVIEDADKTAELGGPSGWLVLPSGVRQSEGLERLSTLRAAAKAGSGFDGYAQA